jgi:hypothetical protein
LGERWYWQANLHSSDESEVRSLYISLSASIYSKFPKIKSCLSVDISVQNCVVKYYLEKKIVINCIFILFFLQWGHIDPMVLLT